MKGIITWTTLINKKIRIISRKAEISAAWYGGALRHKETIKCFIKLKNFIQLTPIMQNQSKCTLKEYVHLPLEYQSSQNMLDHHLNLKKNLPVYKYQIFLVQLVF